MTHKHIWATDKMRDRCGKCGEWRRVHQKCTVCKEKRVNVKMCKCTLKGLK